MGYVINVVYRLGSSYSVLISNCMEMIDRLRERIRLLRRELDRLMGKPVEPIKPITSTRSKLDAFKRVD